MSHIKKASSGNLSIKNTGTPKCKPTNEKKYLMKGKLIANKDK